MPSASVQKEACTLKKWFRAPCRNGFRIDLTASEREPESIYGLPLGNQKADALMRALLFALLLAARLRAAACFGYESIYARIIEEQVLVKFTEHVTMAQRPSQLAPAAQLMHARSADSSASQ